MHRSDVVQRFMIEVRLRSALVALAIIAGVAGVGCAHAERTATMPSAPTRDLARDEAATVEITEPSSAFDEPQPVARPRLSSTVTISEGTGEWTEAAAWASPGQTGRPAAPVAVPRRDMFAEDAAQPRVRTRGTRYYRQPPRGWGTRTR